MITETDFHRHVLPKILSDRFYAICLRLEGSPDRAEDLVQTVAVKAWAARHTITDLAKISAWLTVIATRTAYSLTRKREVRARKKAEVIYEFELLDSGASPEEILDEHVEDQAVGGLIDGLPEPYAETVRLRRAGLAYREIAVALGIPIGTVMSRLHRARPLLRELMSEAA